MLAWFRRHPVACFLILTFAVTWGAWIPLAVMGRDVTVGFDPAYLLGLLGPMIGALVTTAMLDGRRGLRELAARMTRLRVGLRWWGVALGVPLAAAAATYVVLAAYSVYLFAPIELPSSAQLGRFNGFPVSNAIAMLAMLIVVNGLGEETGWRGFLLPRLQRTRSPLVASLGVAGVWMLWHVPAFFVTETYRQMSPAMIPMIFVGIVSGSVFATWLYNRGRSSILLIAVWHGTFNWLTGSVGARTFAPVETTTIVVIAALLVIQELRAFRSDRAGGHARHVLTVPAA